MWPGSYWWRGIRRQRTGPEVKLLRCCPIGLLGSGKANSSAAACEPDLPSGFNRTGGEKQGNRECVCVCLCEFMHASMSFIFSTSTAVFYVTGLLEAFVSHQNISLSFPLAPSVQTFYCINLLKHFWIFSGVIWERARLYQKTFLEVYVSLNLAFSFSKMFLHTC